MALLTHKELLQLADDSLREAVAWAEGTKSWTNHYEPGEHSFEADAATAAAHAAVAQAAAALALARRA